jgi:hypothetical protein
MLLNHLCLTDNKGGLTMTNKERDYMPSQAEGNEETTEHPPRAIPTPSQAEGSEKDYEAQKPSLLDKILATLGLK